MTHAHFFNTIQRLHAEQICQDCIPKWLAFLWWKATEGLCAEFFINFYRRKWEERNPPKNPEAVPFLVKTFQPESRAKERTKKSYWTLGTASWIGSRVSNRSQKIMFFKETFLVYFFFMTNTKKHTQIL